MGWSAVGQRASLQEFQSEKSNSLPLDIFQLFEGLLGFGFQLPHAFGAGEFVRHGAAGVVDGLGDFGS